MTSITYIIISTSISVRRSIIQMNNINTIIIIIIIICNSKPTQL